MMVDNYRIFDNISTGIFIIDSNFRVVYWNTHLEEWTNIKSPDIEGQILFDFFPEFRNERVKARLEHTFEFGSPVILSSKLNNNLFASENYPNSNSNVYEVSVTCHSANNDSEENLALFTVNNVTDLDHKIQNLREANLTVKRELQLREEAESALRESEEKLRLITDNITDLLWQAEIDSNRFILTYISPSVKKIRGLTVEEALSEKLEDIFIPESLIHFAELIDKKLNQVKAGDPIGYEPFVSDFQQYRKDKSIFWVQISARLIRNVVTSKIELVCSTRDISIRKLAETALYDSTQLLKKRNTEKDKFISILAHDLVNAIGGSIPLVELIEAHDEDWEERDVLISELGKNTRAAYNLLSDLIAWGKASLRKQHFDPIELNVCDTFSKVQDLYTSQLNQKDITLNIECDKNQTLRADQNMIDSILRNLVKNAIKYTDKTGSITLKAISQEAEMVLCVSDTGRGMPKEKVDSIFSLDKVMSEPGTDGERGTGLGLQIVNEYVAIHCGKIWVESEPGKGSSFYFSIPQ
ncbi:ATP-binding protein [Bacteroidota bacterium]